MKRILVVFMLFIAMTFTAFSQSNKSTSKNWIWGPSIGYQYQKGSFLKASGWGLFALNESQFMKIDAGANFTWMLNQSTVIPELGITYYLNNVAIWPFIKAEITPYTANAKAGIGLFNLLEFSARYGHSLKIKEGFKSIDGFTAGLSINIPLKFHLN